MSVLADDVQDERLPSDNLPSRVLPFLKWAGGKRWFVERFLHLAPESFGRYIEPFLGSGAIFFALTPSDAILSDLNVDLIGCYIAIRESPRQIIDLLSEHHSKHCKDYYYFVRSQKPADAIARAAWFIYLNRTCWNGLYRVNLKNIFNVPIGTKTQVVFPSDNFVEISSRLKSAEISIGDFETTLNKAGENDFVFVDPPYTVKHNTNGFIKYNDHIFSWTDQVRLRDAIDRATRRGAKVLVTNANHESIRDLYAGLGRFTVLPRSSVLAANSLHRTKIEELAVQTWKS